MIARYSLPEMSRIWTEENKFQEWLEVELAALEALARYGVVPKQIPAQVRAKARFDVERIQEIERVVQHDVIAFLTNLAENVGPAGRYVHYGLTSSDILDTALALQLQEASEYILQEIRGLMEVLRDKALEHKRTIMVGRSHGVHAEPTTFGLKMALFYAEFGRNLKRMEAARDTVSYGKISGAVGTFANVDPKIEEYVCKKLGLKPAPISTQILQRDRHAEYLTAIAVLGGSLEKLATEIRGLQKTETLEVQEPFGKGQKGSSAMPHKRNPVTCERIAGLARVLRGNALAALENVALWHERDITHSSVERIIFPDSTTLVHYMLRTMQGVVRDLVVNKENMKRNLELSGGMIFSQGLLLKLIHQGLAREEAYRLVQEAAKQVWDHKKNLKEVVLANKEIRKHLKPSQIEEVFDYHYHLKHVDTIFERVGIKKGKAK